MDHATRDWMTAASCVEGPPPTVTFADLPRQHQGEMVRFALVAVVSTTYFIVLGMLGRPLPSRSLVGPAPLPQGIVARSSMPDPLLVRASVDMPRVRARTSRSRPVVAVADLGPLADGSPASNPAPRRNPFSRFFRGVFRAVASPD